MALMNYPDRLFHVTPGWVKEGEPFHIRIRTSATQHPALSDQRLASALIGSTQAYHRSGRWHCTLSVLMPDHLHALLRFPRSPGMSETVRAWKRGCARLQGVRWLEEYFDHRLRNDDEAQTTFTYIRNNPVVKGLCETVEAWPYQWSASPADHADKPAR